MFTFIDRLINPADLTPHGFCLLWEPGLIWTHALADLAIGTSYFVIPIVLLQIARRRGDLTFKPVFWMVSVFILLCGVGHLLDMLTLWVPAYGIQAAEKSVTALVSVATAFILFSLLPRILALPSPAQMRAANDALRLSQEILEATVVSRTHELIQANIKLQAAAEKRERVEDELRQSHKMEAVGHLSGGLAHDFNNQLAVITGNLDLVRMRLVQGRVNEVGHFVEEAFAAISRAAALTRRLLAFSRHQTFKPMSTDVNRLIAGLEDLFRRTAGSSIIVRTQLAPALWHPLCDQNQLENALLNLVINARDAMPKGGYLTIETTNTMLSDLREADGDTSLRDVPPGEYVTLAVTDSGIGMAPAVAANAFNAFFTTKPEGQGTGLGLPMIFDFAQQCKGHVHLRSGTGQGTTMTIYLPRHIIALPNVPPLRAIASSGAAILAET